MISIRLISNEIIFLGVHVDSIFFHIEYSKTTEILKVLVFLFRKKYLITN